MEWLIFPILGNQALCRLVLDRLSELGYNQIATEQDMISTAVAIHRVNNQMYWGSAWTTYKSPDSSEEVGDFNKLFFTDDYRVKPRLVKLVDVPFGKKFRSMVDRNLVRLKIDGPDKTKSYFVHLADSCHGKIGEIQWTVMHDTSEAEIVE